MVCPNQNARYPCSLSHTLTLFNGCPWFMIGVEGNGVFSAVHHPHTPTAHAVWRDASILMNYYPCVRVVIFCLTNCAEHYVVQGMRTQSGAVEFRSVPYDGEDWSGWVTSAQVPHDATKNPQGGRTDLPKNTKESPARTCSKTTATPAEGPSRKNSKLLTSLVEESEDGETTVAHKLNKSVDAWLNEVNLDDDTAPMCVRDTLLKMKMDELRAFISIRGFKVKTNTGGYMSRYKEDIVDDVLAQDADRRATKSKR